MTAADESNNKTLPQPRQRPGLACQSCHQRKLKCDRQKPCGSCVEAGIECYVDSNRPRRGPKKGHLKDLRTRLATLERNIVMQEPKSNSPETEEPRGGFEVTPVMSLEEASGAIPEEDVMFNPTVVESLDQIIFTPQLSDFNVQMTRSPEGFRTPNPPLPALMRADLNQLFFDRVYFFTPIFKQSKFMTWANQAWASESHACLQYAVWTLAASFSSQFQTTKDSLYLDTRKMLIALEMEESLFEECYYLEHIQALLLMATYEFMQNHFSRAWASAGKAFRLVQLMKLHRLDAQPLSDGDTSMFASTDSWSVTEEKRRVFWLAFCFDRFLCGVNEAPLTFNEEVVRTRLPAAESDFQGDVPITMPFLSDHIENKEAVPSYSVAVDCIVISTVWGWVLTQKQSFKTGQLSNERNAAFWQRHTSLGNVITKRTDLLLEKYPPSRVALDPLLLFTSMMATASMVVHRQVAESIPRHTSQQQEVLNSSRVDAEAAAHELLRLSKHVSSLSPLKVFNLLIPSGRDSHETFPLMLTCFTLKQIHPFIPVPLFYCAAFLTGQTSFVTNGSLWEEIGDIKAVLRELQHVNPSCKIFLDRLDSFEVNGL